MMIDLTYYSPNNVNLDEVEIIAKEVGFAVTYVEQLKRLQIEVEPMIVCLWEVANDYDLDVMDMQEVSYGYVKSIHSLSIGQYSASKLRKLLRVLFKKHGGWVIDDVTPNYSEATRGRIDKYDISNVEQFLKTTLNPI